ncbi:hypothetical protein JL107_01370 [Nakamurella flavida]|uniref:mannan endo-1,4-beta-mannosidase n=1 Tax=Nakamurella flavida TaxID=363630 RepID=A0A938YCE2_9ACTN|nr:hypothetical protein [Nakamurella flavida]MBM9475085.1 hypothetical protein [Nakamurella flavida]MDP9776654.1 mannan endo-1,4-beta-mannosidase [Nakamurella flavida]
MRRFLALLTAATCTLALLTAGSTGVALAAPAQRTGTATVAPASAQAVQAAGTDFVRREGSALTLGGAPFRFSGTNMYWLALDDNVKDEQGAATYPTEFRIVDAFASARASGVTVVRAWANSVGCERCISPRLGEINQAAFASLDRAVLEAKRSDIRLVLSLLDNWDQFHGSKMTYARWRGTTEDRFWTDPQLIADYQAFITAVLTHRNPLTGLAYRDDPTIMAWQTGNELWCQTCPGNPWFPDWTRQIADHIKSVAPRQLVVDGHGTDPACTTACLDAPSLQIASVDIVDDHHYPPSIARLRDSVTRTRAAGKAYLVGEYDWRNATGGDRLADFLTAVETSGAAGDLFWGLIPHADRAGFVDHQDSFEFYFPGRDDDERARSALLRRHAEVMSRPGALASSAAAATAAMTPGTPVFSTAWATPSGVELAYRGVGGASVYTLQRMPPGGTWTTVYTNLRDQKVTYHRSVLDPNARAVSGTQYRIRAYGLTGIGGPWSAPITAR